MPDREVVIPLPVAGEAVQVYVYVLLVPVLVAVSVNESPGQIAVAVEAAVMASGVVTLAVRVARGLSQLPLKALT